MSADTAQRSSHSPLAPAIADGQAIKIIGLGGIGNIVARYGCLLVNSVRNAAATSTAAEDVPPDVRVVLIDGDLFEPSNATRMLFASAGNKAAVVRGELLPYFGQSHLEISALEEYVTPENIARLIHEGDIVLLSVDNHATRRLVDAYCSGEDGWPGLQDVCLISAGNDGVGPDSSGRVRRGTYGNCQVYLRSGGQDQTASLSRYHNEIKQPADRLPTEQNCLELLSSVPQVLPANLQAASAMLTTLWLHLCGEVHYNELAFDIAQAVMRPVETPLPPAR